MLSERGLCASTLDFGTHSSQNRKGRVSMREWAWAWWGRSLIRGILGSPSRPFSVTVEKDVHRLSYFCRLRHHARTRVWHAQSALERQGARATRNLDTERRRPARVPPSVAETSSCQGACHRKYTVLDSNLCIAATSTGPSPAVASARVRAMADYPTGVVLG